MLWAIKFCKVKNDMMYWIQWFDTNAVDVYLEQTYLKYCMVYGGHILHKFAISYTKNEVASDSECPE
jgi:hypothetical protein